MASRLIFASAILASAAAHAAALYAFANFRGDESALPVIAVALIIEPAFEAPLPDIAIVAAPRPPAAAVAEPAPTPAEPSPAPRPRARAPAPAAAAPAAVAAAAPTAASGLGPAVAPAGETRGAAAYGSGISNPPPAYPPAARRRGVEGRVVLAIEVTADGRAARVTVAQSSGSALLDRVAADAVRGWRFVPAMTNGQPVAGQLTHPVTFRLTDP